MSSSSKHPSPQLLVVDDDEGLLFLIVDALLREGFAAHGLSSGEEALEWLGDHSADLILLDLKLADISALALVERWRERGRAFPFIIVTGHGDERTAVDAMKQGALDYVMKDAGMLELLPGIVRRALGVVEREKKLAEANESIRQREERHLQIIQTALDGFVRLDRSGRLLEVNAATARLLGRSPEELVQRNAFETEAPIFRPEVRQQIERLEVHEAAHCFTRITSREGTEIDVEVSLRREGNELFGFVHDISEQRRLEREIMQTTFEERRRFGHELHDSIGQQLTALEMMTHTLARELKTVAPKQAKSAFEITNHIRHAITQTRELAHGLSPIGPDGEGLMNALEELARMTSSTGVACEFHCEKPVKITDSSTAGHLYRIAQEAVTNALKHARATKIDVRLVDHGSAIELSVEDNGKGLPRRKAAAPGMGMQVMQHRARLIGAQLTTESTAGKGLRIVSTLPKSW